jgi:hypothetical protein
MVAAIQNQARAKVDWHQFGVRLVLSGAEGRLAAAFISTACRANSLTATVQPRSLKISERHMKKDSRKSIRTRSERTFAGLPLIDVALGPARGEPHGKARGIIAIGDEARGWLALGGSARGYIALGGSARGILALGGKAMGIVALGGISVGLVAMGGLALGAIAMGGLAAGGIAVGGLSAGALSVDGRERRNKI